MTDTGIAAGAESAVPANDGALSIREAADAFARRRESGEATHTEPDEAPEQPVEPVEQPDSSPEDNAGPERSAGDDDQGADDPAPEDSEPPIEPPRSWTKEDKEAFKSLPRETQERIADRERARERDFLQRQEKAADERKAAEAERQRLEQARTQYESALPQLLQSLNAKQNAEFSDIKSQDDVVKLAKEDPFRYLEWDALQKQRHAVWNQHQQAQQRQQQEKQEQFKTWAEEQDKLIAERIPDLNDPEKAKKIHEGTRSYLSDLGFEGERLNRLWSGAESLSMRDAKVQELIMDAQRWRAAQKAAKAAATKPVPPVQRPGTPVTKAEASADRIKTLETRLERATSTRDQLAIAAQLRQAKRAGGR